jgi:hypothetical protein
MDTIVSTTNQLEIAVAGARVIIPAAAIADLWLERARMKSTAAPRTALPRIDEIVDGGKFKGIVRGGSQPDYLLFDHGEAAELMPWEAATKWAESQGGSLPTRREQSVLFANRAEGEYRKEWYWSCEQYAGGAESAWVQDFGDGSQGYGRKGDDCRARVVRRQAIQ